MITITNNARERTITLLTEEGKDISNYFIRVGVKGHVPKNLSMSIESLKKL
jgi:Fe-S cluster assembly iron-binding protein IscA